MQGTISRPLGVQSDQNKVPPLLRHRSTLVDLLSKQVGKLI